MQAQANAVPLIRPTARELEVLRLICEGLTTKQIALQLGVAFKTAASHRSSLMEKAGAGNVVHLVRWAVKYGFASL